MSKKSKSKKNKASGHGAASATAAKSSAARSSAASAATGDAGKTPAAVQSETAAVASFERKSAHKEARKEARKDTAVRKRKLPNWPLLIPAMLGMVLTAYLSYTSWAGDKLAYCGAGSGCDLVQSSRWATLLGAPVAFWGLLTYTALAWIAVRVKDPGRHWQAAWIVALPALGISLYLTSISLWEIQATCFYCLTSLSLMVIVVVILAMQGRRMPGISWPGWLSATGGLAAAIVLLLHLHYSGVFSPAAGPEDPYLRGLADKLTESGVKMYGASWCPHCQAQKALFGSAAAHLPYVECSPNGPNAPSAPVCVAQGVESYPTWIFPNDRHSGEIPVEELAQRVGYPPRPKGN